MKKLPGSTIAEVVIALTIIAICFAVASHVFVQTNRSTTRFAEVEEQTEFQSDVLEALIRDTLLDTRSWNGDLTTIETTVDKNEKGVCRNQQLYSNGRLIWQQELYHEE